VITDTYTYFAFGQLKANTGTTTNRFTWVGELGYVRDTETGEYQLHVRQYLPDRARFKSNDPAGTRPDANLHRPVRNDPVNRRDPSGKWTEDGLIEAYARLYGENEKAMIALFTVLSFFKLEHGNFWADDYSPPDPEKGVIQIAKTAWIGKERTNENAAEQLYEIFWRYFREFGLPRTWSRFAYDLPVGATKATLGAIGTVTTGAGAIADPEPFTKIGLAGAAVVSADFMIEGGTQIFDKGSAGGVSLIQEAAGWYGRTVGGEEGEESARTAIGVAQFALGLRAGLLKSKAGATKLSLKNFRGTLKDLKQAGIEDFTSIRTQSRKLQEVFEEFRTRFRDPSGPATLDVSKFDTLNIGSGGEPPNGPNVLHVNNEPADLPETVAGGRLIANATNLDMLPDGHFSAVQFNHIPGDPEAAEKILGEAFRVLKPGGSGTFSSSSLKSVEELMKKAGFQEIRKVGLAKRTNYQGVITNPAIEYIGVKPGGG
jgi:RHS repeat-associated protein